MKRKITHQTVFSILFIVSAITFIVLIAVSQYNKPLCDGAVNAKVITWIDDNENGVYDPGEKSLGYVQVGLWSPQELTDEKGETVVGEFKPGCCGRCWEGARVAAAAPEGYRPTTPTEIFLSGPDEICYFGFVQE